LSEPQRTLVHFEDGPVVRGIEEDQRARAALADDRLDVLSGERPGHRQHRVRTDDDALAGHDDVGADGRAAAGGVWRREHAHHAGDGDAEAGDLVACVAFASAVDREIDEAERRDVVLTRRL
jgi:hypothetical protein